MKLRIKKWVVYLLATMMIMPAWAIMGMMTAPKASAMSVTNAVVSSGSPNMSYDGTWNPSPNGDRWHVSAEDTLADANISSWAIMDPGLYEIEAQWIVWHDHTESAIYQVLDNGSVLLTSDAIDQSSRANGLGAPDGTLSGYYKIGTVNLTGSNSKVRLDGFASDDRNLSFYSIRINHSNVIPSAVSGLGILGSPGGFTNINQPTFVWNSASDDDDQTSLTYQLRVSTDSSFSDPTQTVLDKDGVVGTSYTVLPADALPGEDNYFARVRAYDGQSFGPYSPVFPFTLDTTAPTPGISSIALDPTGTSPIPITVVFDEPVSGFELSDVVVGNGITNNFAIVDARTYTFDVVPGANGEVTVDVPADVAADLASNMNVAASQFSREFAQTAPAAPDITVSAGQDKIINVSWQAVVGASYYYVFVGNQAGAGFVSQSDKIYGTSYSTSVSEFGTYYVRVVAVDTYGNQSTVVDSVTKQKSIILSASVAVAGPSVWKASVPFVVSEADQVAESTVAPSTTPAEEGLIKGEEAAEDSANDKINWTPWIILFILILLAGAATGGYFYWFGGDNEKQEATAVVKEKKTEEPKTVVAKKPAGGANKKSRRW